MALTFSATEFTSEVGGFRIRSVRDRWVALTHQAYGWEMLSDECQSLEDAIAVCNEHLKAVASEFIEF